MRRKYGDCQRQDGDCTVCSLVNYGRDCHNQPITKLEWTRRGAGMSQQKLSAASGVHVTLIQKIEYGKSSMDNITAKTLFALADALDVDPRDLMP